MIGKRTKIWTGILMGCLLAACQDEPVEKTVPQQSVMQLEKDAFVQGKIRIKFKSDADMQAIEALVEKSKGPVTHTGITAFDALGGEYGIKSVRRLFPYSPKFEARHQKHGLNLWYELEIDSTLNTRSAGLSYQDLPQVEYAGPVYKIKSFGNDVVIPYSEPALPVGTATRAQMPFNDRLLNMQWHYDRGKLMTPLDGANIGLFEAWKQNTGSPDVIVAVFDGGIDFNHEDLAANMWVNEAEKNGEPGKDDDGNIYVDDIYGYNFEGRTGTIVPSPHGTHVAGTVAAVNNNGKGVCGVAGGDGSGNGVRIMCCQILGANGSSTSNPDAYIYAADMGAVISQNSWGYTVPGYSDPAIKAAIDYFIEEAGNPEDHPNSPMRGGIVIFAAGNDGRVATLFYPAAYDECISVTATDYRNERASQTEKDHSKEIYYANVGDWVDISAPGGMLENSCGVLSTLPENGYGYMCGTSMACPHVSGVAALIVSQQKGPAFTSEKLKQILLSSVLDLSEFEPNYARYMGRGLVRADKAVNPNDNGGPETVSDLAVTSFSPDGCTLSWKVTKDEGDGVPALYRLYYSNTEITESNYLSARSLDLQLDKPSVGDVCSQNVGGLEGGLYYFAVIGIDHWGNTSSLSNIVTHCVLASTEGRVYPMVVKNETMVYLGAAFQGAVVVKIYDAVGNRVIEQKFKDEYVLKVQVSGLTPGVYTLKVKAAGAEGTFRIVKN